MIASHSPPGMWLLRAALPVHGALGLACCAPAWWPCAHPELPESTSCGVASAKLLLPLRERIRRQAIPGGLKVLQSHYTLSLLFRAHIHIAEALHLASSFSHHLCSTKNRPDTTPSLQIKRQCITMAAPLSFAAMAERKTEEQPLRVVQLDTHVVLKIVKHCKEGFPTLVTGQLLGLDVGQTLEVTDCFPFPVSSRLPSLPKQAGH